MIQNQRSFSEECTGFKMHLTESHSIDFLMLQIDRENSNVEKSVVLSITKSCRENHLIDRENSYIAVKPAQF